MYRFLLPVLLVGYLIVKYRLIGRTPKGPVEGQVLYPRQDARFAHGAATLLEVVFVLEFVSHTERLADAWVRLLWILAVLVLCDVVFYLKLKNTGIRYDKAGIVVRSFWGGERAIPWEAIREVRTTGTGVKSTRTFLLKTSRGTIRINAKSGGLERLRRILEEKA